MVRQRSQTVPTIEVTDAQIAEAMALAVALRRRNATDPSTVRAIPLDAYDAIRMTDSWWTHTRWQRFARGDRREHPSWVRIGWVAHETAPWGFDRAGRDRYNQTWEVWLHADDGRVWLRWQRLGRDADDPYP